MKENMDKMKKIIGMCKNETDHFAPVASIPDMDYRSPKQESLIEKCLKAIVKERMSGCLRNAQRKKNDKEQHTHKLPQYDALMHSKPIVLRKALNQSSSHNRYQTPLNLKVNALRKSLSKEKKLSNRRSGSDFTQLLSGNKLRESRPADRSNHSPSFISSIQCYNPEKDQPNEKHSYSHMASQMHLPKIRKQRQAAKINPDNIKALFRNPQELINRNFWIFLTQREVTLLKTFKNKKSKTQFQQNFTGSKEAKSFVLKSIPQTSSKQQVNLYISLLPKVLSVMVTQFLSFFEIKLPNEISMQTYANMLETLKAVNARGWCALSFRFWDFDSDGLISSQDVFLRFRELNDITDQKQEMKEWEHSNEDKDEYGATVSREIKQNSKMGFQEQLKSKIHEADFIGKCLKLFHYQMNKLNLELTKLNSSPQKQAEESNQQKQIKYLEEVIINSAGTKYKDIEPLLSAGKNQHSASKKEEQHKLEIFPKNLNIKCSSSYRQCFIATEHNEETREIRQKIQSYKEQLKAIKANRRQLARERVMLNLRTNRKITYEQFVESRIADFTREIVTAALGHQ